MNDLYIGKAGEEFGFAPTQIANGLTEMMEIWKEEIAAGTSFPLPILFGRATAAGMGSAMYLVFERFYWNEIANIQASISDDVLHILMDMAGFEDLEDKRVDWKLAIQKTDQQRLIDEQMQIENEILKEQYVQAQIQTRMILEQAMNPQPQVDENPQDNPNSIPKGNGGKKRLEEGEKESSEDLTKQECITKHIRKGKTEAQAKAYCQKRKTDFITLKEQNQLLYHQIWSKSKDRMDKLMNERRDTFNGSR
jgi:hypothetical protein